MQARHLGKGAFETTLAHLSIVVVAPCRCAGRHACVCVCGGRPSQHRGSCPVQVFRQARVCVCVWWWVGCTQSTHVRNISGGCGAVVFGGVEQSYLSHANSTGQRSRSLRAPAHSACLQPCCQIYRGILEGREGVASAVRSERCDDACALDNGNLIKAEVRASSTRHSLVCSECTGLHVSSKGKSER